METKIYPHVPRPPPPRDTKYPLVDSFAATPEKPGDAHGLVFVDPRKPVDLAGDLFRQPGNVVGAVG